MSSLLKEPLPRLFVRPDALIADRPLILQGTAHHYLTRVLRLTRGDRLLLLDGRGRVADSQVVGIDADTLTLQPTRVEQTASEGAAGTAPRPMILLIGLIKGERHDLVIQKATELGASQIISVVCARSVPDLDGARGEKRQARWLRVAQAAAGQCRRADVPRVSPPLPFAQALQESGPGLRLVFCERDAPPLRTLLSATDLGQQSQPVSLLVGPEGGLTGAEIDAALAVGYQPCSLGPHILRAETAALAALAATTALLYG